jgi:hypothetical protein
MRVLTIIAAGLALGAAVAQPAAAQGPVRQGLRRTGEVAVEGTRRVVQGAGQAVGAAGRATVGVAQGAADVTRGVVGGAVDATGRVIQGTAQGVAAGVDAITPNLPLQARAGATLSAADQARDARWRFAQHNGEWWYYSPENSWMYHRDGQWNQFAQDSFQANPAFDGQYASGYRGVDGQQYADQGYANQGYADQGYVDQAGYNQQYQTQGPAHTLYTDANGREYICENGRRVYLDNQGAQGEYGAAYRGPEGQQFQNDSQMMPTPAIPTDPNAPGAEGAATIQGQTDLQGQTTLQQGQTNLQGQTGAAVTTPAASATTQGAASTTVTAPGTPAPPSNPAAAAGNASGALSPESPRDVLQSSGSTTTQGTVEAGQQSR